MKEKTYLSHDGIFVTKEEYSEFVRTEIVVNAATHRDYAIRGTDIQIKMFDDRLEADSPGTFPGMVKKENIRYTHFSRNPKIAAFLKDYGYVKEYGEGIDRMCKELESIGLPAPVFDNSNFILKTTVMSASFKDKSPELASIERNDASIQTQNASIERNDASIQTQNASIEQNGAPIQKKNALIERIILTENAAKIAPKDAADAKTIIAHADTGQAITAKEAMKILSCQTTKARRVLKMMEQHGWIKAIQGQGKGKYMLSISE